MGKEMTTCPHCGEVVEKGNFCNKCGKKLSKICDCWLMKRPYHCNFQQCPDMAAFTLLLLHIQQDQKHRKYVFLEPILVEMIDTYMGDFRGQDTFADRLAVGREIRLLLEKL